MNSICQQYCSPACVAHLYLFLQIHFNGLMSLWMGACECAECESVGMCENVPHPFVALFIPPALMKFHLLDTMQCSEAIMFGTSYETMEGHNIEIGCDGESLTVNGIKMVLKKDIVTTNGVIHLIDQVLMPDSG